MQAEGAVLEWPARRTELKAGLLDTLAEFWCRLMHDDITWPVYGHYRCRRCHRLYPVPWEEPAARASVQVVRMPGPQPQISVWCRVAA
jgi:hypothetical protein